MQRLQRVEAELGLLLLLRQIDNLDLTHPQLILSLLRLRVSLGGRPGHLVFDRRQELLLNLHLVLSLLHRLDLALKSTVVIALVSPLKLSLVAVETALDQLADEDVLLVKKLLSVLLQLFIDRFELGCLLVDAGQLSLELLDFIVEVGYFLCQLRDLLHAVIVSETSLRLLLHEPLPLAFVGLDVSVELDVFLVNMLLLLLQFVRTHLDLAILFCQRLVLLLVFLAFGFMVLDDLFVAFHHILLLIGVLVVSVTILLEAGNFLLEMVDGLPQVGIRLLDADGLLLLSEVFALSVVKLCLRLLLLFGQVLYPLLKLLNTCVAAGEDFFVVLVLPLHHPCLALNVDDSRSVLVDFCLDLLFDLQLQVLLEPLEVDPFGLEAVASIRDLLVFGLDRLDVVVQLLEKRFVLS